jgi:hypothetical protein
VRWWGLTWSMLSISNVSISKPKLPSTTSSTRSAYLAASICEAAAGRATHERQVRKLERLRMGEEQLSKSWSCVCCTGTVGDLNTLLVSKTRAHGALAKPNDYHAMWLVSSLRAVHHPRRVAGGGLSLTLLYLSLRVCIRVLLRSVPQPGWHLPHRAPTCLHGIRKCFAIYVVVTAQLSLCLTRSPLFWSSPGSADSTW